MLPVPEFTTLEPPKLDLRPLIDALTAEGRAIQRDVAKDFHRTTATWTHQPVFRMPNVSPTEDVIDIDVFTSDDIYAAVNDGTKMRVITTAKKAFRLPDVYTPKTLPGVINSFGTGGQSYGFISGKVTLSSQIKPRKFDTAIADKWRPEVSSRLQDAMIKAVSKVNHSV